MDARPAGASPPRPHAVALGPVRKVPYLPPDAMADSGADTTLRVRPLTVDGVMREWTVGDFHDVTDRTFVIRRALRINDALPGEPPRWSWQPGPWLQVDRVTGHIAALHLPDFDAGISDAVWFRDYAAYCGLHVLAKSTTLTAMVVQLGARRAAVSQRLSAWPLSPMPRPVCAPATWERGPIRVTMHPAGMQATTFDVLGTTSLIEEADDDPR